MSTLAAKDLHTGYGKVEIVSGVSVAAESGQIVCIFGPNGSGKSTLLKTLAGAQPVWSGEITLNGQSITHQKTEERILSGIATMPQGGSVFGELSVEANLKLGGHSVRSRRELDKCLDGVYRRFPVLAEKRRAAGSDLSGGQRMLLSFGQMLMTDPDVLLLDEPSAGLAPAIVKDVFSQLQDLRAQGKTVVMVEQNVREALDIADHVYVLVQGQLAYSSSREKVVGLRELMDIYMQVQVANDETS